MDMEHNPQSVASATDCYSFGLRIAGQLQKLPTVCSWLQNVARTLDLDEELTGWLDLTLFELVVNAIRHGHGLDPSKDVSISISQEGDQVEMIVDDQGNGFDFGEVKDPTAPENILQQGGRGLFIVSSFMDEIEVTQPEGGGNRVRTVKKI